MGWEAPTLVALADFMATCTAAQDLAEATGTTQEKIDATLAKIVIGPQLAPTVGTEISIDELAEQHVQFQVFSPTEGGTIAVVDGESVSMQGAFGLITRRHCRDNELEDRQDLWLFFLDRINALEQQLCEWFANGEDAPRLRRTERQMLAFGTVKQASRQGEFLQAVHLIPWGDFGAANEE